MDTFVPGDKVKIGVDKLTLITALEDHGGWNSAISQYLDKVGIVHRVTKRGDLRVAFEECNNKWTFPPHVLVKVDGNRYVVGDSVRFINDANLMKWDELLDDYAGKVGVVKEIRHNGYLHVYIDDEVLSVNPSCVEPCYSDGSNGLRILENLELPTFVHATRNTTVPPAVVELLKNTGEGYRLLHMAVLAGCLEAVRYLLSIGIKPHCRTKYDSTALHIAANLNHCEIVKELLKSDPSCLNDVDKYKRTALHRTMHSIEAAKILLDHNANVNIQDIYGNTVLHKAVANDCEQLVEYVCAQPNVYFATENGNGCNVLHLCAIRGYPSVMWILLKYVSHLVNMKKRDGYAPLHLAALNGHLEIVKLLLQKSNTDIDIENDRLQTALHISVAEGHYDIMEYLVTIGCNINAKDSLSYTAWDYVVKSTSDIQSELKGPVLEEIYKDVQQDQYIPYKKRASVMLFLIRAGYVAPELRRFEYMSRISGSCFFHLKKSYGVQRYTPRSERIKALCESESHASGENAAIHKEIERPIPMECIVCSEFSGCNVELEPCGHKIACESCSSRMKKCLLCQEFIEKRITVDGRCIPYHFPGQHSHRLRYLEQKIKAVEETYTCAVCLEGRKEVMFLCGHSACRRCADVLSSCHICRAPIEQKIVMY